ncbi:MAG: type II toxin-antitoxin system VapC family toxin [Candidatus Omnitrophica bacterium]|nr:type II toxin-antitoxin system VapC family toxin [Candidatus Omnitrophota bacterium]
MSRKAKAIVLDSWAVIAYLGDESAGQKVAEIMAGAHENKIPLIMSILNVGEVWYAMARRTSEREADEVIHELSELGIQFFDADWKLTRIAAVYKSKYEMSYADCFAAALAKEEKADLVTGDKEFKEVETDIKVVWL